MPKYSIIVPIYNAERFISPCVDSCLAQSYHDWELLLINDGSTDKTPALINEYALKDQRIRSFHKSNGGVSSARNVGLSHAKGDYIVFLDVDDYITPPILMSINCLQKIYL